MSFPLRLSLLFCLSLLLASGEKSSTLPGATGIQMTVRHTGRGILWEFTTYFRADARRQDSRSITGHRYGPRLALIERCDVGEAFDLNLDQQEYQSGPYPPKALTKEDLARLGVNPRKLRRQVLRLSESKNRRWTLVREKISLDTGRGT
jgi:hypothetical protein